MHRTLPSRWLSTALRISERPATLDVQLPVFLCPALGARNLSFRVRPVTCEACTLKPWSQKRSLQSQAETEITWTPPGDAVIHQKIIPDKKPIRKLPAQCTGCGALSQASFEDQPGYFDLGRKAVRLYLGLEEPRRRRTRKEDDDYQDILKRMDPAELEKLGLDMEDIAPSLAYEPGPEYQEAPLKVPLCDRCHNLLHHQTGVSIYHPTMDSIRDTLAESPYKYNHVYHILDSADFPMSILPQIHQLLDLMPIRTKNRRSQKGKFYHGQKTEMSFIITRSDLLAPTKDQVDRLVPYLREVLRDALGRSGRDLRLGNIKCVSAKRSWWTKELKEDIWKRGGAGWMVGKVNVGKSQLFESVFPKGRMDWDPTKHQITIDMYGKESKATSLAETPSAETTTESDDTDDRLIAKLDDQALDEDSLLPPAQPEAQYPEMPLVSDLPGTTASPIRVPFGNDRGELIDLPGVERTGLDQYVKEEHRQSLVMRSRIIPEQQVIKQGQSILLGGFIRLTPRVPGPIILSYSFTPLEAHLTGTEKAIGIQEQNSEVRVENIAVPGTGEKIKLAGSFPLKWDVTKERSGPITSRAAVNMHIDRLPYRVLATDILIEGVGWVEVVAQVRTRELYAKPEPTAEQPDFEIDLSPIERLEAMAQVPKKKKLPLPPREEGELNWPIVDVYTPEGKFVGCRKPMNGWLLNKPKVSKASLKARPRKSMKGMKKLEKTRRR
ncbi:uncharacterized protein BCR38DRAFT_317768, partial [Pseudomassariella vexata]